MRKKIQNKKYINKRIDWVWICEVLWQTAEAFSYLYDSYLPRPEKKKRKNKFFSLSLSCPICPPPLFQTAPPAPRSWKTFPLSQAASLSTPSFLSCFFSNLCAYFDQLGLNKFHFVQFRTILFIFNSYSYELTEPVWWFYLFLLKKSFVVGWLEMSSMWYEWHVKYWFCKALEFRFKESWEDGVGV